MIDKLQFDKIYETMGRNPLYDFGLSLVIFPYNHSTFYAILYTEKQRLREMFESYDGVEYYGYWNNTDSDRGIISTFQGNFHSTSAVSSIDIFRTGGSATFSNETTIAETSIRLYGLS